jgi:hypothetical protein
VILPQIFKKQTQSLPLLCYDLFTVLNVHMILPLVLLVFVYDDTHVLIMLYYRIKYILRHI